MTEENVRVTRVAPTDRANASQRDTTRTIGYSGASEKASIRTVVVGVNLAASRLLELNRRLGAPSVIAVERSEPRLVKQGETSD